jgi:hypothetical protein
LQTRNANLSSRFTRADGETLDGIGRRVIVQV